MSRNDDGMKAIVGVWVDNSYTRKCHLSWKLVGGGEYYARKYDAIFFCSTRGKKAHVIKRLQYRTMIERKVETASSVETT